MTSTLGKFAFPILAAFLLFLSYFLWTTVDVPDNEAPSLFKGILRAPCGGIGDGYLCSVIPRLDYQGKKCELNLFLETKNSTVGTWRDKGNIRTSFCFFKTKFDEKEFKSGFLDKEVVISGSMKNATVCMLLKKCSEPECSGCHEEEILVPSDIKLN